MNDTLKKRLETALAHYDKVIFLYQLSQESCIELSTILSKEQRNLLLLTEAEAPSFPCDQRKLCEEECRQLLELYLSYSFSDRFVLLTDLKKFPWPFIVNFVETGLSERGEILEAMLK